MKTKRTCSLKDCKNIHFGKGYCRKHYTQFKIHGECISLKDRHVLIKDRCVIISSPLMQKDILIDEDIFKRIDINIWWYDAKRDIVFGQLNGQLTQLKDYVLGKKNKFVVKQVNGNGADCRKNNLLHIEWHKAFQTKSLSKSNSSGHRGVSWSKSKKKWIASLKVKYKQ